MSSSTQPAPPPADEPFVDEPTAEFLPVTAELSPEEIVATPAVEGDLNQEMKRVAKPFGKTTLVLAGLLVIALSFAGGAWTHSALGSSSGSGTARAGGTAGGARGGFGTGTGTGTGTGAGTGQQGAGQGFGAGGARGAAGRGTVGTVEKVNGTTVTLKTAQGSDVTVSTSDTTTVGLTQPGKLSDLKPGATVTVQGRAGTDGTVAAQTIVQQPAR
ncbi:hypothetical protein [Amycolatopsis saalfeldensis]|uniref:DUF5666 domain-containing protein n=1 Tax=Amycolatopsis saalfeldensis TaxID=394193 RepID=A0A1H8XNR7_9PSEU|nr:hypothetical protein [Amycolatopsis saalfeldensis]SEP41525.1 hypothetical protein SAMN04489732_108170 [Amycolatopsis saalfeldensis]